MNTSLRGPFQLCAVVLALGCAGQAPAAREPAPAATEQTQPQTTDEVVAVPDAAPLTPAASAVAAAPPANVVSGFSTPESVLYDVQSDLYFVSNINGSPSDKDDNGFISKLGPDGTVIELKWIDGGSEEVTLNAPKGSVISNGVLYVADIDTVRKFDASTGEAKGEIKIKGATFLNDVALAPDGTIYVTDSGLKPDFSNSETDAVYAIKKGKAKVLIKSKDLKNPNGVIADESGVWVVTFGANELYNVKDGVKADVKTLPKGKLDGIAKTADGKLFVSSWESNQVFRGSLTEQFVPVVSDVVSPADIAYDAKRNRLLIPRFMENTVQLSQL
jgi:SMP-30/Gluconolactonase/LRE-like region